MNIYHLRTKWRMYLKRLMVANFYTTRMSYQHEILVFSVKSTLMSNIIAILKQKPPLDDAKGCCIPLAATGVLHSSGMPGHTDPTLTSARRVSKWPHQECTSAPVIFCSVRKLTQCYFMSLHI